MNTNDLVRLMLAILRYQEECSESRLVKLVFIAEWVSLVWDGKLIVADLPLVWFKGNGGPIEPRILATVTARTECFTVKAKERDGIKYNAISATAEALNSALHLPSTDMEEIAQFVVEATKKLDANAFLRNMNGLYPLVVADLYDFINLEELYGLYKAQEE